MKITGTTYRDPNSAGHYVEHDLVVELGKPEKELLLVCAFVTRGDAYGDALMRARTVLARLEGRV